MSTVPTFEELGHDAGPLVPRPVSPSWQAPRPAAWPGLIATPSGSVTVVSSMLDMATPSGSSSPSWGTLRSTDRPAGVSAKVVSGATLNEGENERCSQPV